MKHNVQITWKARGIVNETRHESYLYQGTPKQIGEALAESVERGLSQGSLLELEIRPVPPFYVIDLEDVG